MSYTRVDINAPEITMALDKAPIYKKCSRVKARPAIEGETIVTKLSSGVIETTKVAKFGEWVVTNPSGEEYLVSEEKFFSRYDPADKKGVYEAKGYCRVIGNPFGVPIEIMAPWGELQVGEVDCKIVGVCDAKGNTKKDSYLIDGKAFAETYKLEYK